MEEQKVEEAKPTRPIDKVLDKLASRKLIVFLVATSLVWVSKLESSDWTLIALIYMGVQGAIDFYAQRRIR